MSALTNLIEDIKLTLAHSDAVVPEKVQILAAQYAEECKKLNERFRTILPLLQQGNLSEAIRLAEMSPNITDWYGTLDFEGHTDWIDICQGLGYDEPLPLPDESMRMLNDAYLQQAPLEPLLRWNRIYALNNSPIADRLQVVRAIVKKDTMNFFWKEDQEKFEKIRLTQLKNDVDTAIKTKNSTAVSELCKELTSPDWLVQPPVTYRTALCNFVLDGYKDNLLKSFNTFDYPAGQSVYQKMLNLCQTNKLSMPEPIAEAIQPAVQWLSESTMAMEYQNQYEAAVADLQEALEDNEPASELDRCFYAAASAAQNTGMPVPADMVEWYDRRKRDMELHRLNRVRVTVIAIVATCILLFTGAGYAMMVRNFNERVKTAVTALQAVADDKRVDDIDATVDKLDAKIAANKLVVPVVEHLRTMQKKDKERGDDFNRNYAQADIALGENPEYGALKNIAVNVEQCEKLKRTKDETDKYTLLKQHFDSSMSKRQNELDEAFGNKLAESAQHFKDIRSSKKRSDFNTLETEIKTLLDASTSVSPAQLAIGQSLLKDVRDAGEKLRKNQAENKAFTELQAAIPSFTAFQTKLNTFIQTYPNHIAAEDAQQVSKELGQIANVSSMYDTLQKELRNYQLNPDDLQRVVTELNNQCKTLAQILAVPLDNFFPQVQAIEVLAATLPPDAKTFKKTNELLKIISQKPLYPWVDEKNNWYYLTDMPDLKPDSKLSRLKYVTTFASMEKDLKGYSTLENKERNRGRFGKYEEHQHHFQIQAQKAIRDFSKAKSNKAVIEQIGTLLNDLLNTKELDPILQCELLDLIIEDYSKANPVFKEVFTDYLTQLTDSGIDFDTNWMDGDNKITVIQRNLAESTLKVLPELDELIQTAADKVEAYNAKLKRPPASFGWVGILDQNGVAGDLQGSGDLYILREQSGKVKPIKIGKLENGKATVNGSGSDLLQCLPVFVRR
ncbi:hypothetical protein FACS189419_03230 [Planctomycetales bacterium]|nr:hypothetical protein FACS189419_03230 [Planctomycetales bacterium]